jgi:hypothetical protein
VDTPGEVTSSRRAADDGRFYRNDRADAETEHDMGSQALETAGKAHEDRVSSQISVKLV